jgi:transcriptional antiterminator NusG
MDKKWYVVNTYSGHENKVKEKLEMRTVSMGMEDYIFRVIVPEEKVIEEKNGVKKEKIKKLFPGYILVEMIMTDEAWFVVRNTPGVTGFIGSSGKGAKPFPLQPYEVDKILNDMGMSRLEVNTDLKEGTLVKVISGPFSGMEGKIDSVDKDNNKLIVLLDLFGQETSVEVEFSQIEKINA